MKANKAQEEAISHIYGPMILISCPGSGKTTTLIRRIGHMVENGVDPCRILMVTFTKASAEEMEKRFLAQNGEQAGGVTFSTIHALCLRILKEEGMTSDIMDENEKREAIYNALKKIQNLDDIGDMIGDILGDIGKLKNSYQSPETYNPEKCEKHVFIKCYEAYETYRKEAEKLDYEDMMLECLSLLKTDKKTLQKYRDRYRFIQCDEYQDTNLVQKDLLYTLAGKNGNLCVVGDDDQSIYRFRGADPEVMLAFKDDFPGCRVINMSTNYRSAQKIVNMADILIKNNTKRFEKEFVSFRGSEGVEGTYHYERYDTRAAEMDALVNAIRQAKGRGIDYTEMAVLCRTNRQARMPMLSLAAAGIPFHSSEKVESVYSGALFKMIYGYARLACGVGGEKEFSYVLNRPQRYLKPSAFRGVPYDVNSMLIAVEPLKNEKRWRYDNACDSIISWMNAFGAGKLTMDSPVEKLFAGLRVIGIERHLADIAKSRNTDISEYRQMYEDLMEDAKRCGTLKAWFSYAAADIKKIKKINEQKEQAGVSLITMHRSKGLEWKAVFVIDVNDDTVPYRNSWDSKEGLEEERRLLYVAMTRARDELCIMCSGVESRFMLELTDNVREKLIREKYPLPNKGELLLHKTYGIGIVTGMDGKRIVLDFCGMEKKFLYPDAIEEGHIRYIKKKK